MNVYLPKRGGGTSEADLILLTQRGIFVLENKNYHGSVYGSESDWQWTHAIGGKKYQFYNPIRQNETHIQHLRSILDGISPLTIQSIIVFGDGCALKKIRVNSPIPVINTKALASTLNELQDRMPLIYYGRELDAIYEQLDPYTHQSKSVKDAHITAIKQALRHK